MKLSKLFVCLVAVCDLRLQRMTLSFAHQCPLKFLQTCSMLHSIRLVYYFYKAFRENVLVFRLALKFSSSLKA